MKTILRTTLLLALLIGITGHAQAQEYRDVLKVGPLSTRPNYFYIDTKIPFTDSPAPQLQITGYNYGVPNRAIKLTLGWYVYQNAFYWTQYKNDMGYSNPSRIRLGTYDDNGTTRVRIEIANDSTYWSSYFIEATDHNGVAASYTGWTSALGEMPGGTGNITTVSEHEGMVFARNGNLGIGTNDPAGRLDVYTSGNNTLRLSTDNHNNDQKIEFYSVTSAYHSIVSNAQSGNLQIRAGDSGVGHEIYFFTDGVARVGISANGGLSVGDGYHNDIAPSNGLLVEGNVGIGTLTPDQKLTVAGTVKSQEIIVEATAGADFVFEESYDLPTLAQIEKFIKANKHLEGIASAEEMKKNGVKVGEFQIKLLQKIEELTLHTIDQQKLILQLLNRIEQLEKGDK